MNKTALRQHYIALRKSLTADDVQSLSIQVTNKIPSSLFNGAKYIHLFYPIAEKAEYNSMLLASRLRKQFPEANLVLSRSNLTTCTLDHVIWTPDTVLIKNKWNITEPATGEAVSPEIIDVVLIPLLAFDKQGNRLGYGKGFYDRFLSQCPQAKKVGVSFFEPEDIIPADKFDIPLDECYTPYNSWIFS